MTLPVVLLFSSGEWEEGCVPVGAPTLKYWEVMMSSKCSSFRCRALRLRWASRALIEVVSSWAASLLGPARRSKGQDILSDWAL
ncbi:hypothetical protein L195_g016478, partial [Trifolium pratense]